MSRRVHEFYAYMQHFAWIYKFIIYGWILVKPLFLKHYQMKHTLWIWNSRRRLLPFYEEDSRASIDYTRNTSTKYISSENKKTNIQRGTDNFNYQYLITWPPVLYMAHWTQWHSRILGVVSTLQVQPIASNKRKTDRMRSQLDVVFFPTLFLNCSFKIDTKKRVSSSGEYLYRNKKR